MEESKTNEIIIEFANPSLIRRKGRVSLILGKRSTGKTTLAHDLTIGYDLVYVVSGTEKKCQCPYWQKHLSPEFIYDDYSEEALAYIIKKISQTNDNKKKSSIIVLDDLIHLELLKSKVFNWLILNGRNSNISVVFTMQKLFDIMPHTRANIDFVYCFKDNILWNRKRIYNYFGGSVDSFDMFDDIFKGLVQGNYYAMLITRNEPITNNIFYYKVNNLLTNKT